MLFDLAFLFSGFFWEEAPPIWVPGFRGLVSGIEGRLERLWETKEDGEGMVAYVYLGQGRLDWIGSVAERLHTILRACSAVVSLFLGLLISLGSVSCLPL